MLRLLTLPHALDMGQLLAILHRVHRLAQSTLQPLVRSLLGLTVMFEHALIALAALSVGVEQRRDAPAWRLVIISALRVEERQK